jgi:ATP-binding cassette subfamily C (CFTR/MRP) protein 1
MAYHSCLWDACGYLSRCQDSTQLLTNLLGNFLPSSDVILVLDKGTVTAQGTFQELEQKDGYTKSMYSELKRDSSEDTKSSARSIDDLRQKNTTSTKIVKTEDARRQTGDFSIYKFFFYENVGPGLTMSLLACALVWAFLSTFPTVWLKWWSDSSLKQGNNEIAYYLGGYAGLQIAAVISFSILIWISIVVVAAKSGIRLHQVLLQTVMGAPLSLFTSTDVGSITTRFSQDIGILDKSLPLALCITLGDLFTAVAQAILIATASAYIAIGFPFLILVVYYLQRGYLRTSRQLRFFDLEEKAPLYTQFLETLDGLATIRAFGWGEHAIRKNHQLVDHAQKPFYLLLMAQQWLTLVLDLIVAALALFVVGLAVRLRDSVSVGLTGVSLIQLILFSETLKIVIQFWTLLETSIGAVTRIKQFREDNPSENSFDEPRLSPPNSPATGKVRFDGVSASYGIEGKTEGSSVNALDNITFSISPGEKVAVIGRTGSGKSSLLLTLLRMLDISSGSIQVDDIDLRSIPREHVRSKIIVITQDIFFLPGTVRRNIDPYEVSDDQVIHEVLRKVGLGEVIEARGGLGKEFEEEMLSQGQKQLFALGRAILRKGVGKLVVLDEATSTYVFSSL